jgi:hypothetical protein
MLGTFLPFSWINLGALNHLTPPELIEAEEAIFTEAAILQDMHFHIDMLTLSNISSIEFTEEEHVAHTQFSENCLMLRGSINLYLQTLRELGTCLGSLNKKVTVRRGPLPRETSS